MTWLIMTWGSAQDGFIVLSFFDRFGDFVAKMEKATTCGGTTRAIRLPTTSPEPTTSPLARPIAPRPIVFQDCTTERIEAQNHQDHIFIRDRTCAEPRSISRAITDARIIMLPCHHSDDHMHAHVCHQQGGVEAWRPIAILDENLYTTHSVRHAPRPPRSAGHT